MTKDQPTTDLLRLFIQNRSEEAFGKIVLAYIDLIYSTALRHGCDAELAQDVTQLVFISLAQKAPDLRQDSPLDAWLFAVTRNTALNAVRERNRRTTHERKAATMKNLTVSPSLPADEPGRVEPELSTALARLRERDRNLILLRFTRDLTLGQVGAALGITENAAAKRMTRILDKLRLSLLRKGLDLSLPAMTASLAGFSATHAPETLATSMIHNALLASHTHLAATTGGSLIMTTLKAKLAAAIFVACLVAALPAGVIAIYAYYQSTSPPVVLVQPPSVAPAVPPNADLAEFYRLYTPTPANAVVFVAAPTERARQAVFRISQHNTFPSWTHSIAVRFLNGRPQVWGQNSGSYDLAGICELTMGVYPMRFEGPDSIRFAEHPGDFSFLGKASQPQYLSAIGRIADKQFGKHFNLIFRDVVRKVIVLRGQWHFTPVQFTDGKHHRHQVELYGVALGDSKTGGGGGGSPDDFLGGLSLWINNAEVVFDATALPSEINWHFNYAPQSGTAGQTPPPDHDHDKTLVLNHVCQQTGLTWSEELRTVHHLFIEPSN
jgi:RNA polymerase sigma factor (sigma-70 family)